MLSDILSNGPYAIYRYSMSPAHYFYLVDEARDEVVAIFPIADGSTAMAINSLERRLRFETKADDKSSGVTLRSSFTAPLDEILLTTVWTRRS